MTPTVTRMPKYRVSGHETFPCRYTWLPKVVQSLNENSKLFRDEDEAMVRLGVGKNMVRAIRFWADATGVSCDDGKGNFEVSSIGSQLLGNCGHDPFLEDVKTLWLLHWKLATNVEPLFAWEYLLNRWHRSDFTRSEALQYLHEEAARLDKNLSRVTIENHFDTFLHTYVPTRSKKGEVLEDNLDCPLVELDLVTKIGERTITDSNRRENIYAFRLEEKAEITAELLVFCLDDFWRKHHQTETSLTLRDVTVGIGSPGQIFKLPDHVVRQRLEELERDGHSQFGFQESAAVQRVIRRGAASSKQLLAAIYR